MRSVEKEEALAEVKDARDPSRAVQAILTLPSRAVSLPHGTRPETDFSDTSVPERTADRAGVAIIISRCHAADSGVSQVAEWLKDDSPAIRCAAIEATSRLLNALVAKGSSALRAHIPGGIGTEVLAQVNGGGGGGGGGDDSDSDAEPVVDGDANGGVDSVADIERAARRLSTAVADALGGAEADKSVRLCAAAALRTLLLGPARVHILHARAEPSPSRLVEVLSSAMSTDPSDAVVDTLGSIACDILFPEASSNFHSLSTSSASATHDGCISTSVESPSAPHFPFSTAVSDAHCARVSLRPDLFPALRLSMPQLRSRVVSRVTGGTCSSGAVFASGSSSLQLPVGPKGGSAGVGPVPLARVLLGVVVGVQESAGKSQGGIGGTGGGVLKGAAREFCHRDSSTSRALSSLDVESVRARAAALVSGRRGAARSGGAPGLPDAVADAVDAVVLPLALCGDPHLAVPAAMELERVCRWWSPLESPGMARGLSFRVPLALRPRVPSIVFALCAAGRIDAAARWCASVDAEGIDNETYVDMVTAAAGAPKPAEPRLSIGAARGTDHAVGDLASLGLLVSVALDRTLCRWEEWSLRVAVLEARAQQPGEKQPQLVSPSNFTAPPSPGDTLVDAILGREDLWRGGPCTERLVESFAHAVDVACATHAGNSGQPRPRHLDAVIVPILRRALPTLSSASTGAQVNTASSTAALAAAAATATTTTTTTAATSASSSITSSAGGGSGGVGGVGGGEERGTDSQHGGFGGSNGSRNGIADPAVAFASGTGAVARLIAHTPASVATDPLRLVATSLPRAPCDEKMARVAWVVAERLRVDGYTGQGSDPMAGPIDGVIAACVGLAMGRDAMDAMLACGATQVTGAPRTPASASARGGSTAAPPSTARAFAALQVLGRLASRSLLSDWDQQTRDGDKQGKGSSTTKGEANGFGLSSLLPPLAAKCAQVLQSVAVGPGVPAAVASHAEHLSRALAMQARTRPSERSVPVGPLTAVPQWALDQGGRDPSSPSIGNPVSNLPPPLGVSALSLQPATVLASDLHGDSPVQLSFPPDPLCVTAEFALCPATCSVSVRVSLCTWDALQIHGHAGNVYANDHDHTIGGGVGGEHDNGSDNDDVVDATFAPGTEALAVNLRRVLPIVGGRGRARGTGGPSSSSSSSVSTVSNVTVTLSLGGRALPTVSVASSSTPAAAAKPLRSTAPRSTSFHVGDLGGGGGQRDICTDIAVSPACPGPLVITPLIDTLSAGTFTTDPLVIPGGWFFTPWGGGGGVHNRTQRDNTSASCDLASGGDGWPGSEMQVVASLGAVPLREWAVGPDGSACVPEVSSRVALSAIAAPGHVLARSVSWCGIPHETTIVTTRRGDGWTASVQVSARNGADRLGDGADGVVAWLEILLGPGAVDMERWNIDCDCDFDKDKDRDKVGSTAENVATAAASTVAEIAARAGRPRGSTSIFQRDLERTTTGAAGPPSFLSVSELEARGITATH